MGRIVKLGAGGEFDLIRRFKAEHPGNTRSVYIYIEYTGFMALF